MPAALEYIRSDEMSSVAAELERAFETELRARQANHAAYWKLYKGEHHKHLKRDNTQTDDNIIVNMVELIVDKGVSELVGTKDDGTIEGVDFDIVDEPGEAGYMTPPAPVDANAPAVKTPAQDYLDAVWDANRKNIALHNAAQNGGVCGHVFVKLIPDAREYWKRPGELLPRLVVLNPDIVTVFWDESDYERVLWYRIEYGPGGRRYREDVVRNVNDDGTNAGSWTIYTYRQVADRAGWVMQGEPVLWDYAWAPVHDWPNLPFANTYYGRNDFGLSGDINSGLNFLLSNMQRIIKHHANPKTIAIGVDADEIKQTAVNGLWAIKNPDAQVFNLEMVSDLGSSMEMSRMLRRYTFDGAREVDPSSVRDRLGDLTNFALRVLYGDTLGKVGTKRLLAEIAVTNLSRHILELGGFPANVAVNAKWPGVLPKDEQAQAQALDIDRRHGLSRETYLEKRGYDATQEGQRRDLERSERIEDETVTRQVSMADALAALGERQRQVRDEVPNART